MELIAQVTVTPQQIADQVITAFEGGSNYWLHAADLITPPRKTLKESPWYSDPQLYAGHFLVKLTFENPAEGADIASKVIDESMIRTGLEALSRKNPREFANVLSEDGDASTADCFLQCVLFGEILFG